MLIKKRQFTDITFVMAMQSGESRIDWHDVTIEQLHMTSDLQGGAFAGVLVYQVGEDGNLVIVWDAASQNYLGDHRIVGKIEINGTEGSFDIPAVDIVATSAEADNTTDTIELEGKVSFDNLEGTINIVGVGKPGKDAMINGKNTITIQAGKNITIAQEGETLTISGNIDPTEWATDADIEALFK